MKAVYAEFEASFQAPSDAPTSKSWVKGGTVQAGAGTVHALHAPGPAHGIILSNWNQCKAPPIII